MIGHNWGAEHAERWTWIQANEFARGRRLLRRRARPDQGRAADHARGSATRCCSLDGEPHRLGGFDRIRSTKVDDEPTECEFELAGKEIRVRGRVSLGAAQLRRLGLRRPGRARAQHAQLLDLRPRADRRAQGARAAAARVRRRRRLRARHARDRPRDPAAALSRRLSGPRAGSADLDDLELLRAARRLQRTRARRLGGRAAPCRSGSSTESLPLGEVGLERVHEGHLA